MSPSIDPIWQEAYDVLFRIVRQSLLGQPIGRDALVSARSVIRRADPDRYKALADRRSRSGLPPVPDEDREDDTLP